MNLVQWIFFFLKVKVLSPSSIHTFWLDRRLLKLHFLICLPCSEQEHWSVFDFFQWNHTLFENIDLNQIVHNHQLECTSSLRLLICHIEEIRFGQRILQPWCYTLKLERLVLWRTDKFLAPVMPEMYMAPTPSKPSKTQLISCSCLCIYKNS